MSQISADETIDLFISQWKAQDPDFKLDDPEVRDQVATLISAFMSLLAIAPPEVWQEFMDKCAKIAKTMVPKDVQAKIKGDVYEN